MRLFAFRLCLELGELHPDILLSKLTSRQLTEWMAAFQVQPFGQDVTIYMLAQLTALIANTNRKKGRESFKPSDFMPIRRRETPEEMKLKLRSILGHGRRRNP